MGYHIPCRPVLRGSGHAIRGAACRARTRPEHLERRFGTGNPSRRAAPVRSLEVPMDNVTAARKEAVPAAASAAPDTGSAQSTVQAKPEIDGFNLLIEALKLNGIDTIFG